MLTYCELAVFSLTLRSTLNNKLPFIMGYTISYLWLYAINFITTALLLAVKILDIEAPRLIHWGENVVYCMGIWMLLSLWGKAFEAKEDNHSKPTLDSRIIKLLTLSLVIIEGMAILSVTFDKSEFILPSFLGLIIWLMAFSYLSLVSKKLFECKTISYDK